MDMCKEDLKFILELNINTFIQKKAHDTHAK